ncbi:hypothetical protein L211DRAFT_839137 [Terfezia boudieri ATCC MYA-4762]|uniref:HAD-like protein n=1 Tax=Terfezia boudieri ATCC MYA-4762 TaxID=1051890 RepID=A0A3N4LJY6_9PEZI|nr:hypothetical protein L211DRAFT_839137 [Terfezia boudieri ATCC MYA-4762]
MTRKVVLAFDLYDILVDTSSISTVCPTNDSETFDTKVTSKLRTLPFEYTWRLNSMGKKSNSQQARTEIGILNIADKYVPMDEITRNSLRHALKEGAKSSLLEELETKAMGKYNELEVFPDTARFFHQLPAISASLRKRGIDIEYLIFSNGAPNMVEAAISISELLSTTFVKDGRRGISRWMQ